MSSDVFVTYLPDRSDHHSKITPKRLLKRCFIVAPAVSPFVNPPLTRAFTVALRYASAPSVGHTLHVSHSLGRIWAAWGKHGKKCGWSTARGFIAAFIGQQVAKRRTDGAFTNMRLKTHDFILDSDNHPGNLPPPARIVSPSRIVPGARNCRAEVSERVCVFGVVLCTVELDGKGPLGPG